MESARRPWRSQSRRFVSGDENRSLASCRRRFWTGSISRSSSRSRSRSMDAGDEGSAGALEAWPFGCCCGCGGGGGDPSCRPSGACGTRSSELSAALPRWMGADERWRGTRADVRVAEPQDMVNPETGTGCHQECPGGEHARAAVGKIRNASGMGLGRLGGHQDAVRSA